MLVKSCDVQGKYLSKTLKFTPSMLVQCQGNYEAFLLTSTLMVISGVKAEWRWWNSSWAVSNPVRWCYESAALNMTGNLENSAVATGLEKVSFIPITKKGNAKECSNYHTIALISQSCKTMLKILQGRLQQYMNRELPDVRAGFRKGRGTRAQIANICSIIGKAREFQKYICFYFIDYTKAFDCVDHNKLWKIQEMGIPEHLTCFLRNLYAGQETTFRTGHGTTDWFQIGKGVCQGYILSPC